MLQRLNIMTDVASALEYLRHGYSPSVDHCDIKPSNILLDDGMVAHVADFGIAEVLRKMDTMVHTMTLGTIGYMAPEQGVGGIVSTNGNVYSYGILLMEIFTKRKPRDEMFVGDLSLRKWVKESLSHQVFDVVDANLVMGENENSSAIKDCLSSIMVLALSCSSEERKTMRDVLVALHKIKMKFMKEVQ